MTMHPDTIILLASFGGVPIVAIAHAIVWLCYPEAR
jgi:phage shock protein PspC (stress-responsive transcriptional regulator)